MRYVRLLSKRHKDIVLKIDGEDFYQYDPVEKKWVESVLFIHYLYEGSPLYDLYEFIDEERAKELIKLQKERIEYVD